MNTKANERPLGEADEIEALLPWLVTGKLSREDEARVSRYLESHPDTAGHVALAREEHDAAITLNEAIKAPGADALDRLMTEIAVTPQPRSFTVPSPASVWERVAGLFSGLSINTLGMATVAAAVALLLQTATIGVLVTRDHGAGGQSGFKTASDGEKRGATGGVQALVVLQPGVTAAQLTSGLKDLKAAIVDGPRANMFRLKVAADSSEAAATLEKLKARSDLFSFVGPAPH